jgi:hypothetical protein
MNARATISERGCPSPGTFDLTKIVGISCARSHPSRCGWDSRAP